MRRLKGQILRLYLWRSYRVGLQRSRRMKNWRELNRVAQRPTGLISEEVFIRLFFTYMVFGFIGIFALFVPSFFIPSINATFGSPLNVLVFLGYIDLGFILVITVIALLVSCLRLLKSSTAARRYVRRVLDLETKRNALRKATESAARQWSSAYHAEYLARIRQIESERDSTLVPFEEQRQQRMAEFEDEHKRKLDDIDSIHQRMDEIAAEHARTLAEIAARYAGGDVILVFACAG